LFFIFFLYFDNKGSIFIHKTNESIKTKSVYIASLIALLPNVFNCLIDFFLNKKFKEEFKRFYCLETRDSKISFRTNVTLNISCKNKVMLTNFAGLDHMKSTEV
jgi:hypothetical protein